MKLTGPSDEVARRNHANVTADSNNFLLAIENGTIVGTYADEDAAREAASEFARTGASFANELRLVAPGNVVGTRLR